MTRRFQVRLRTAVDLVVAVEATGFEEAVKAAEAAVRPTDYFAGNDVADGDGVEVEWAQEHVFAYVDELGGAGECITTTPATFTGSNLEIREDGEGGWRQASDPEYAPSAAPGPGRGSR